MTLFQMSTGLETIFPAPTRNEVHQNLESHRAGQGDPPDSAPFKEVFGVVDQNQRHKAIKPEREKKPLASQSNSAPKEMTSDKRPEATEKSTQTEKSEENTDQVSSEKTSLMENGYLLPAFQSLLEKTPDPVVEGQVPHLEEELHLKPEPVLLGKAGSEAISEGNHSSQLNRAEGEFQGLHEDIKNGLVLTDIEGMTVRSDSEPQTDLHIEEPSPDSASKESQPITKTEVNANAKPAHASLRELAEKGLEQGGEGPFSEPESDREAKEGIKSPTLVSKGEMKSFAADVQSLGQAEQAQRFKNNEVLGASQRESIVSQVSERFKTFQTGKSEQVRIQLEPESLGSIQIEISVQKGGVIAHLVTGDLQVKALLETHQAQLRERLVEQGFRVDQFSVDVGDTGRFFDEKRESMSFSRNRQGLSEADLDPTVGRFFPRLVRGNGLINLYV